MSSSASRPEDATACWSFSDQIYTDVLCGSIAGAYTVVVRPISLKNPLHALRYAAESPFRLLYKVKQT